jgi:hypothetical protein
MGLDTEPQAPRSSLANMDTLKGIVFPFEPTLWRGGVRVNYNDVPAIGAPHAYRDYQHTSNETFEAEFTWHRVVLAFAGKKKVTLDEASDAIDRHRRFLRSCTVVGETSPGELGGKPPLLWLNVPGVMSVYCRIDNIDWQVPKRSPKDGRIVIYTARISFTEEPQYRVNSEDIINDGYGLLLAQMHQALQE